MPFELVTAMYAAEEFHLRDDWKSRRDRLAKQPVLAKVEPVEFLQAISLLHTKALREQALEEGREPPGDQRQPQQPPAAAARRLQAICRSGRTGLSQRSQIPAWPPKSFAFAICLIRHSSFRWPRFLPSWVRSGSTTPSGSASVNGTGAGSSENFTGLLSSLASRSTFVISVAGLPAGHCRKRSSVPTSARNVCVLCGHVSPQLTRVSMLS